MTSVVTGWSGPVTERTGVVCSWSGLVAGQTGIHVDVNRSLFQNVNRMLYTGSSDHTGRGWVTEFGDCTRIYKGQKHTVSAIKYHEGLGTSPDSRLLRGCAMNHLQRHHLCVYVHVCSISYSELVAGEGSLQRARLAVECHRHAVAGACED